MKLVKSLLDTPVARGARVAANIKVHGDAIISDNGSEFVRNCCDNFSQKIGNLTKQAILLGLNNESESREEFKARRDSWFVWLGEIDECVKDIDGGETFNPVQALTAIAWLEAELFGFEETLGETRRSTEIKIQ